MSYAVVIKQNDEEARLLCETLEEAQMVKQSFVNYGKCQSVTIQLSADNTEHVAK